MIRTRKGSIFLYILFLVNVALITSVVVFNNSMVQYDLAKVNSITESLTSNIYAKADIALKLGKNFNANGEGGVDEIDCPQDITMSGSISKQENITTTYTYSGGVSTCVGTYSGDDIIIYFDTPSGLFTHASFDGDLVDLVISTGSTSSLGPNTAPSTSVSGNSHKRKGFGLSALNNEVTTIHNYEFYSEWKNHTVGFTYGSDVTVGKIVIYNGVTNNWSKRLTNGIVTLKNSGGGTIDTHNLGNTTGDEVIEIDYGAGESGVRKVELTSVGNNYITIREVEIFELTSGDSYDLYTGDANFPDGDSTLISFDNTGPIVPDGVDDNLNNDDYMVTSAGGVPYPGGYEDDDADHRKKFYGYINPEPGFQNIFWNNGETNSYIDNNSNNNDGGINAKIGDVGSGAFIFDIDGSNFNIKVTKINKSLYDVNGEVELINSFIVEELDGTTEAGYGYITEGTGGIILDEDLTASGYVFDFLNNYYAVFIENTGTGTLAYQFEANVLEVSGTGVVAGSGIYINPIDDSDSVDIKVLANDIIIDDLGKYLREQVEIVGNK